MSWTTAQDLNLVEEVLGSRDELIVGGIYVRLFVSNPNWGLRKPREFLVELFEYWIKLTQHEQNPKVRRLLVLVLEQHYVLYSYY